MQRQAQEIVLLRAMIMGIAKVLPTKVALEEAELERAVRAAYTQLTAPPRPPPSTVLYRGTSTDPYRGGPANEPSPEDVAAAKALLAKAHDRHFSKRFQEARVIYQQLVDEHGDTKQAAVARQQLENLQGV